MKYYLVGSMILVSVSLYMLTTSCNKDKISNTTELTCDVIDPTINKYSTTIKPIFDNNCATSGCHDVATASATIILDNYNSVKDATTNKNVLCALKYETTCSPMPPAGKINDTLITYINCWKEAGFPQ